MRTSNRVTGVRFHKRDQIFEARKEIAGFELYLGRYEDRRDAVIARQAADRAFSQILKIQ